MLLQHNNGYRFYHWFSVSVILHAGIVLPFALLSLHASITDKHSKLQIDLFGMISDRQAEQKIQRHAPPQQPRQVPPPRQSPDAYKTVVAESPVQVKKAEEKQKTDEQTTQQMQPKQASAASSPSTSSGAASSGNSDTQQSQQTIRSGAEQESGRIRGYLARLAKVLRTNLTYPEEVRKHGVEGVSTITFVVTQSGGIKGDSLRVKKSSGYAALDSNALKSVRTSAPFEKPPKELTVSVALSFNVNMTRARVNQQTSMLHLNSREHETP